VPTTGPSSEYSEYILHPPTLVIEILFNIILPCMPQSDKWSFSSGENGVGNFSVSGYSTPIAMCSVKFRPRHFLFGWSLKNFELWTPAYLQSLHMACSSPKYQCYMSQCVRTDGKWRYYQTKYGCLKFVFIF